MASVTRPDLRPLMLKVSYPTRLLCTLPGFILLAALPTPLRSRAAAEEFNPDVRMSDVAGKCGGHFQHDELVKLPDAALQRTLRCFVREMAKKVSQDLPTRVEYTTIVDPPKVVGITTVYRFRADIDRSEIAPGAMSAWKPSVQKQICANPGMRDIISLGGRYRYVWLDHDGRYIDSLEVRQCRAAP